MFVLINCTLHLFINNHLHLLYSYHTLTSQQIATQLIQPPLVCDILHRLVLSLPRDILLVTAKIGSDTPIF